MGEQKVLLQWDSNWADEMDISGFVITTEKIWKDYKKELKKKEEFCIYVGSNEEIDYSDGKELLEEISVTKLSDEEADLISKKIGTSFGFTDFFEIEEEDEDY